MQRYLMLVLFFYCLGKSCPLAAQKFEFTHYYSHDGLSQSTISAIQQDYQGFMWIGTFNGLNRYDGYAFKVYKKDPALDGSLTSSHIEALYEDKNSQLWVGTADGVNRYNRKSDSFEYYRYDSPGPSNYAVQAFVEDQHGTLWVGGWQGLCYVDSVAKKLINVGSTNSSNDIPKTIFDIVEDLDRNSLWLATAQGLYNYDIKRNEFFRMSYPDEGVAGSVPEGRSLLMDHTGDLWVGTTVGLYQISPNIRKLTKVLPMLDEESISDIEESKSGLILMATEHGLVSYDSRTGKTDQYRKERSINTLSDNAVRKIYFDHNENLWLGTFYGLNYNGGHQNFTTLGKASLDKPGLNNSYVTTLCSGVDENVFVGTAEGIEAIRLNKGNVEIVTHQFSALEKIRGAIVSIASDGVENLIISSWPSGFYRYNIKKNTLDVLHNIQGFPTCGLPALIVDQTSLWIGCENSLFQYDLAHSKLIKRVSFERGNISYIRRDSKNNLLCGGQSGMMSYNIETGQIIYYKSDDPPQSLHNVAINNIHEDVKQNLWIATQHGLMMMDKHQKLISYRKTGGFADDDVRSIAEDAHANLWISTTNRLYRFNRESGNLRTFEMSEGLSVSEFSESAVLTTKTGQMIFGGKQGLVIFHPDSIRNDHLAPEVVITDLRVLNRPVPVGDRMLPNHISVTKELTLDYTAKEFSFEFVGIDFSASGKTEYAYIMEGFDTDWNFSGKRRFASYTNLPPGREYTFRVMASDQNGVWGDKATSLKLYIIPPFWETWWFKMITYATALAAIIIVYKIRTTRAREQRMQLQHQKVLLEEEVRAKTADLIAANQKLQEQSERITHMNALLKQDNLKLEHDLKDLVEARVMQKRVSFDEFRLIYPDNEACYKFIDELKSCREFQCKKCNHHKCSKGQDYSRRCSKCNYVETIITGTIFAGIKFPISKAFYLLFLLTEGKHYTMGELSEMVELRQQTCWTFKKRLEERANNLTHRNKDGWSHLITISDLAHQKG